MKGSLANICNVVSSTYYVSDIRLSTLHITSLYLCNNSVIQVHITWYSTDKETDAFSLEKDGLESPTLLIQSGEEILLLSLSFWSSRFYF